MPDDRTDPLTDLIRAWRDPGPRPHVHAAEQAKLRRHWPTLARALDALPAAAVIRAAQDEDSTPCSRCGVPGETVRRRDSAKVICDPCAVAIGDACPNPLHGHPLPGGYVAAADTAAYRLRHGWANPRCPDCHLYGWRPPARADLAAHHDTQPGRDALAYAMWRVFIGEVETDQPDDPIPPGWLKRADAVLARLGPAT